MSVHNFDTLFWELRFDTIAEAEIAASYYVRGFTDAHSMGAPAAVAYILASGIWPAGTIHTSVSRPESVTQRPGEWFTTFLIRAARDIARNLQDKPNMKKFKDEYDRCCDATK